MKFYHEVRNRLGHRINGFDYIFNYLLNTKEPIIVETGCARMEDNYGGDGQSSLLFDKYVKEFGGEFHTIDISKESTDYCKGKMTSSATTVHTADSITKLKELNIYFQEKNIKIDFLYLDSFDAPKEQPHVIYESALHHLYELLTISPSLKKNALIGVDDNWIEIKNDKHVLTGKGGFIFDYMKKSNRPLVCDGYQLFWKW